jgi:N-acetylneuraminic acid mutarotase
MLEDGRVLVAGGRDGPTIASSNSFATAELFDPTTGRWSATGSMNAARGGAFTMTRLAGGAVLVIGGAGADGELLASAEVYDPESRTFHEVASLSEPRAQHTATLLEDGRVIVIGGAGNTRGEHSLASAELFDPNSEDFAPAGTLTAPRGNHRALPFADGRVIALGGYDAFGEIATTEIFDPAGRETCDQ